MTEITKHSYSVLITEKHLDTFGHVNNATYLELYEEARWDLITAGGWGLSEIKKREIGPVVTSLNIQYKREIKNREEIVIETIFDGFRNSKILTLKQQMINSDGAVANTMSIEAGLFDLKNRRLLDPTDEWMRALGVMNYEF
ncbi:MAG: thioesterase [Bacteriovorax sp. MedPE-SWde]|nr:MAG: thioesterase [Bacteriovorax sp. MedPE-SWde]